MGSKRFDAFTWDGMAWHGMMKKKMMMIRSQYNHLHCISEKRYHTVYSIYRRYTEICRTHIPFRPYFCLYTTIFYGDEKKKKTTTYVLHF